MMSNIAKKIQDRTLTEIIIGLSEMHDHMMHEQQTKYREPAHYMTAVHYIGMNYDLHLQELRNRGQASIAQRYEERMQQWREPDKKR